MVLTGYIDESYSGEQPPRMFGLTCVMALGSEWPWIEMAWQKCLDEKNLSLKARGRQPIARYHSVDINNFRQDFADWTGAERNAFCEKLVKVFARHLSGCEGYLINLQELVEEWPETAADPVAFAYEILLKFLLCEIGDGITKEIPGTKIRLFHERCPYDAVLLDSFNQILNDPTFTYKSCFTTLAPMGWEDCIPLQLADLLAYENFKEGYRTTPSAKPRERRLIIKEIISLESFAARAKIIDRVNIKRMKQLFPPPRNKSIRKEPR